MRESVIAWVAVNVGVILFATIATLAEFRFGVSKPGACAIALAITAPLSGGIIFYPRHWTT